MNDAGRIGFVIRGDYSKTATYDFLDVVYYGNSSYVAKKLTIGNEPVDNNEYWQILAKTPASTVTGVKGAKETDFRTGNINLTPENIGATPCGSVHNGDFNNITKPGLYSMTGSPVNGPVSGNHCFSLIVLDNVDSQAIHQMAILEAEEEPYIRYGVPSVSVWTNWKKGWKSRRFDKISTLEESGYFETVNVETALNSGDSILTFKSNISTVQKITELIFILTFSYLVGNYQANSTVIIAPWQAWHNYESVIYNDKIGSISLSFFPLGGVYSKDIVVRYSYNENLDFRTLELRSGYIIEKA